MDDRGGPTPLRPLNRACRIVLVTGFESFNVDLYKQVISVPWIRRTPNPVQHPAWRIKRVSRMQHCVLAARLSMHV